MLHNNKTNQFLAIKSTKSFGFKWEFFLISRVSV